MRTLCSIAAALTALGHLGASDWPHQRGPLNNGALPEEARIPATLPPDPRVLWKVDVTDGFAAPIVSGDRVFYGDLQKGKETFHALRLADGEALWSEALDAPHRDGFGTGPRCAPSADGRLVLLQSCKGELHCRSAEDGKLIWKKNYLSDFGAPYIGEKGKAQGASRHGYAASPIFDGGHVITLAGGPGAAVVCLDKTDGAVVWQSQDDLAAYSPPRVATLAGVEQVVCFTVDGVIGLDRKDGRLLWRVAMRTDYGRHIVAPLIHDGLVIVGSHQVGYIATRVVERDGEIVAETAWKLGKEMGPNFASSVRIGEQLYMLAGNSVVCLDVATGNQNWAEDGIVNTAPARAFAAFIGMGERVLMLNDMGELILFETNPAAYREISRTQVCGKNWCHPAYADGKLVVRDAKQLLCIDLFASE